MNFKIMSFFEFSEKLLTLGEQAKIECENKFKEIDDIARYNQQKVLSAFIEFIFLLYIL